MLRARREATMLKIADELPSFSTDAAGMLEAIWLSAHFAQVRRMAIGLLCSPPRNVLEAVLADRQTAHGIAVQALASPAIEQALECLLLVMRTSRELNLKFVGARPDGVAVLAEAKAAIEAANVPNQPEAKDAAT